MVVKKKKEKYIPINVRLVNTDEVFPVRFVKADMKIKDLRGCLELATGIPSDLQKVYYLDESDLPDNTEVRQHDIVAGAVINLEVWHTWRELIDAVVANDPEWVLRLGVTKKTTYSTPNSEYMLPKQRMNWIQKRADVALFVAAHRGFHALCQKLIVWGADVNGTTPEGRTALHVSATQDHGDVINLLLNNGTNIDKCDVNGLNALAIANQFGHKGCERHLFMFRWQERAKAMKPQFLNPPLMAHQRTDSLYPQWRMGKYAQVYMEKLLPPGEFIGSAINAPIRKWHRQSSLPDVSAADREDTSMSSMSGGRKSKRKSTLSFDEWLHAKQRQDRLRQEAIRVAEEAEREAEEERQRQEYEKSKSYESWMAEQQLQTQSAPPGGLTPMRGGKQAGGRLPPAGPGPGQTATGSKRAEGKDDLKTRVRGILSRYKLEDGLNAYEQWLKDKMTAEAGGGRDTPGASLPYQTMIREFCEKNCPHHYH